jgi:hypothetical protein
MTARFDSLDERRNPVTGSVLVLVDSSLFAESAVARRTHTPVR